MIDPHNGLGGGRGLRCMSGKALETPTPRLEDRAAGPSAQVRVRAHTHTHASRGVLSIHSSPHCRGFPVMGGAVCPSWKTGRHREGPSRRVGRLGTLTCSRESLCFVLFCFKVTKSNLEFSSRVLHAPPPPTRTAVPHGVSPGWGGVGASPRLACGGTG